MPSSAEDYKVFRRFLKGEMENLLYSEDPEPIDTIESWLNEQVAEIHSEISAEWFWLEVFEPDGRTVSWVEPFATKAAAIGLLMHCQLPARVTRGGTTIASTGVIRSVDNASDTEDS